MSSTNEAQGQEPNPLRRPVFLAAAAFLALVMLLGLFVVIGGGSEDDTPQAQTTSNPSAVPTEPGNDCGLTDHDQSIPTTAPTDVTWSVFKTVAVPDSQSAGPGIIEGDVARCYAHTPRGALVAAWQINARRFIGDDWRQVTLRQVVAGPGRDAYLRLRAKITDNSAQPGQYGQLAGFKFVTYTPPLAVIQTVSRFASGRMQVTTLTMAWTGGDWKLQLQPNGADSPSVQPVASLEGFVIWGGI